MMPKMLRRSLCSSRDMIRYLQHRAPASLLLCCRCSTRVALCSVRAMSPRRPEFTSSACALPPEQVYMFHLFASRRSLPASSATELLFSRCLPDHFQPSRAHERRRRQRRAKRYAYRARARQPAWPARDICHFSARALMYARMRRGESAAMPSSSARRQCRAAFQKICAAQPSARLRASRARFCAQPRP